MNTARRALWTAGLPARALLIGAIRLYRATFSGLLGGQCRFHPSCSAYAEEAVRTRGAAVGASLAVWRVLRCNPFGRGGLEAVPLPLRERPGEAPAATYDVVTLNTAKDHKGASV